ncbi:hypothetical protein D3C87_504940 [compost metagenome]
MSGISVFETPMALMDLTKLIELSPYGCYPWGQLSGEKEPITMEEVAKAIADGDLIQPGVFADNPVNEQRDNIAECSRAEHIQRIAWFVQHFDASKMEQVQMSAVPNIEEPEQSNISFSNGHHRVAALIYRGLTELSVELCCGKASLIEQMPAFKGWLSAPVHDGLFGYNIVSNGSEAWEMQINPEIVGSKIWITKIESMGMTMARMSINKLTSSFDMEDSDGNRHFHAAIHERKDPPVTTEQFLDACSTHLSGLFSDGRIRQAVNDRLAESAF